MRRPKEKSKTKKYSPVRLLNPSARLHTAQVHPRQGIRLIISPPHKWFENCSKDAVAEVEVCSDYLMATSRRPLKSGDTEYRIDQKYDLESWAAASVVFLGEIRITVKNNTHPSAKNVPTSVCVNLHGSLEADDPARRVLTVINPDGVSCKLAPNQILEVIAYEEKWNNWQSGMIEAAGFSDEWGAVARTDASDKLPRDLCLTKIKQVTIAGEDITLGEQMSARPRFSVAVNPALPREARDVVLDEIAGRVRPCRQHHFYFSVPATCEKKLQDAKKGVYQFCQVELQGQCQEVGDDEFRYVERRSLSVNLAICGDNKDAPDLSGKSGDVLRTECDYSRRVLRNPKKHDQFDARTGMRDFSIELPSPQHLYPDIDPAVAWKTKIDKSHTNDEYLRLVEQPEMQQGGVLFRRWRVDFCNMPSSGSSVFLGAVVFYVPGREDRKDGVRRISVWARDDEDARPHKRSAATTDSGTHDTAYFPYGFGQRRKSERSKVTVEEISFESLGENTRRIRIGDLTRSSSFVSHFAAGGSPAAPKTVPLPLANKPPEKAARKEPFFTVYSPDHQAAVTIKPDQRLLIRMAPPSILLDGKAEGEVWSTGTLRTPRNAVYIDKNLCLKSGNTCQQEITVAVDQQELRGLPPGSEQVGAVRLECSAQTRLIRIFVNVPEEGLDIPDKPAPPFKVIDYGCRQEANGNYFNHLKDWHHNDAVRVGGNDFVYIRSPRVSELWGDGWQVDFHQYPVPEKAWRLLPLSVRQKADTETPWCRPSPPQVGNDMIVLKPLEQTTQFKEIVEAMSEAGYSGDFLVGRFDFHNRNCKGDRRFETPHGVYGRSMMMSKSLGVYVNIPKRAARPDGGVQTISDPAENQEIVVRPNERVVIKMSPVLQELKDRSGLVPTEWYMVTYPGFMENEGPQRRDNENVFPLRARERSAPRSDYVRFQTANSIRNVVLRYEAAADGV